MTVSDALIGDVNGAGAGIESRAETVELQAHHFCKKLQKSRETCNFTAFPGGPDRIRTDDPHNANVMRSQLRYRPILTIFQSKKL